MKNTITIWIDKRYRVEVEDVRRNIYEGVIYETDDTGLVLQSDKSSDKLILIPWSAVCCIKKK